MRRCLVIGGAGNLGGQILRRLVQRGVERVASFDLAAYSGDAGDGVESHVGDLTDSSALVAAMQGVDTVFHLASVIDIRPVVSPRMHRVNVVGTERVIAACRQAGVRALIYTATMEVVSGRDAGGATMHVRGVEEDAPIPAVHQLPYGATKAQAELLVLGADSPELRTCSIRPGLIMGAGAINLRMALTTAAQRRGYYVTARVPATLSTVHVKNCALLHVLAAEQIARPEVHGHAFFARDFEANAVELALGCFDGLPGLTPVIINLRLAYLLGWAVHLLERALVALAALFGRVRVTRDDVLDIRAVRMAYIDIVVSGRRAREVLGYEPLISQAECMREAKAWCVGFWASLAAAGK